MGGWGPTNDAATFPCKVSRHPHTGPFLSPCGPPPLPASPPVPAPQAESLWLHLDIIKALAAMCSSVFVGGSVSYATTTIPTYPSGQIGMMLCSKARAGQGQGGADGGEGGEAAGPLDPRTPRQPEPGPLAQLNVGELQYYSHEVHSAAFALPVFAKKALQGSLTFQ